MECPPRSGQCRRTRPRGVSPEPPRGEFGDVAMEPAHSQAHLARARVTFLPPRSVRLAVIVISLLTVPMPAEQSVPDSQQPASRPRVGLALGGGAARGLAHVGVLEWFEEHRIPVDAIAGTSIGGLVGGGYATGGRRTSCARWWLASTGTACSAVIWIIR